MVKRSEAFLKQLVVLVDVAAIAAAFPVASPFGQSLHAFYPLSLIPAREVLGELTPLDRSLSLLLIILPLWIGMLHVMGAYRELRVKSYQQISWIVLKASVLGLLGFGSAVF